MREFVLDGGGGGVLLPGTEGRKCIAEKVGIVGPT